MTAADRVRDMIQSRAARVEGQRDDLSTPSERAETVWLAIDAHLKAADLCELLCEDSEMIRHLAAAKMLLAKIPDERFN